MKTNLLILCATIIGLSVQAQNFNKEINLNTVFSKTTTINPFMQNEVIAGIAVSGNITFNSNTSFVRIIVSDENGNVYMLYETYPMLTTETRFSFEYECEETCFLNGFEPVELQIQVRDASVGIGKISLSNETNNGANELSRASRLDKNRSKLAAVQEYIERKGLIWTAAETEFSKMPFSSKAKQLGMNYSSFGFEYYAGGIYSVFSPLDMALAGGWSRSHGFVDNFDWRSRHGANNPASPYYDGDPAGSGWMTPVVCQGEGCWFENHFHCNIPQSLCNTWGGIYRTAPTCWIFGPVAQVEALVNLYYNQHIDVKLSEQYVVCKDTIIRGGNPTRTLDYFKNEGIPDDDCLTYSASLDNCEDECINPTERIWINNHSQIGSSNIGGYDGLKKMLIQKGPLTVGNTPYPWGQDSHAMLLVGWGTIDEDTYIYISGIPNPPFSSYYYGYNYWIYKDSRGPNTAMGGYVYIMNNGVPGTTWSVDMPITSLNRTSADVRCVDEDGDGYYFWGLGPKPATCPCWAPDEPDGDDSNPSLGPINEFGQCAIIDTYTASFETGWDNWIQVNTDDGDWWRSKSPVIPNEGPQIPGAQDGDYFIYVNSTLPAHYPLKNFIIESPPINLTEKSCYAEIDFYYHMHTHFWFNSQGEPNPDLTKLELQISYDNGQTWVQNYWFKEHNQGAGWKHATVNFPSTVNKVRFVGRTGHAYMSDIALDNITIRPAPKAQDLVINIHTTWSTDKSILGDVVIANNSILTIKNCTISLSDHCKITIHPGSKLIIDGSTLTNACEDQMWYGIFISGNSQLPQTPQHQGVLELKNRAIIENARNAIATYRLTPNDLIDFATTGGIIRADNAIFRNNRRSVEFLAYSHIGSSSIPQNISYFNNCTFIVDDKNLFESNNTSFGTHITMWGVSGVQIRGCTFENSITNMTDRRHAIYTEDAGYIVDQYCSVYDHSQLCLTCKDEPKPSIFKGFNRAIKSLNSRTQYAIKIDNSRFENNAVGISLSGKNSFQISRLYMPLNTTLYIAPMGLHLNKCTKYKIEGNEIYSNGNGYATGILVENVGSSENRIYRNQIYKVYYGIRATAGGAKKTNQPPQNDLLAPFTGLQFICNDFNNNYSDISVPFTRAVHGSRSSGADNLFSESGSRHFTTEINWPVRYYYDLSVSRKEPVHISSNIKLHHATKNLCHSSFCTPIIYGGDPPAESSLAEYRKLNKQYSEMLDYFYAKGYDEILNDYYNKIIRDEKLLEEVLAYLEDISTITEQMAELSNEVLLYLKTDSIIELAQIRDWYDEMPSLSAKYSLAEIYNQLGSFKEGLETLESIPAMFNLDADELIEHKNYVALFIFKNNIRESGRVIAELTKTEINSLIYLAEASHGLSSIMAQNILCFFYEICFEKEICVKPSMTNSQNETKDEPADETANYAYSEEGEDGMIGQGGLHESITLYPNPGKDHIIVISEVENCRFELINVMGVTVESVLLKQGNNTINTSALSKGIYIYKVMINNEMITGKWVKIQ